ncbi:MAG: 3-oxoacyl-ACP reductase FabG [Candidatus Latescibacteria bacterium]|nr:3-oxoacyl-ACP reductase FabG [Candidatus Latescibacterota bacterium]
MKLKGKVALVTGGTRGLGRAYVLHLARLGADVVINDIDLHAAREYGEPLTAETVMAEVENLGRRALGIQADVTRKDAVDAMVERTLEEFGRLDILVNNAGGNLQSQNDQSASGVSPEHYAYIMDTNLTGTILCCQAASRPMKNVRSGRIVNVSSQAGLWSGRDGGGMPYKVAKAGIIQYTRVLAAELGPYGICVNCIAPGFILSSRAVAQGRNSEETRTRLEAQIPLRRLGTPEDCARVVEFLVTDLSDYVTGQCIPVCGGFVAF